VLRGALAMRSGPRTVLFHTPGCVSWPRQCVAGAGEGQPTQPEATNRRVCKSQSGWPINPPGLRDSWPMHPLACTDAVRRTASVRAGGASLGCPVRRRAHPRCSLRSGGTSPDQKPPGACAYSRRPAPVYAPGCSGLCPCPAFAPSARDASGPGSCDAKRVEPLRKRPICGAHDQCSCLRAPSVCHPLPSGISPRGNQQRSPARWGSGRCGEWPSATRGEDSCQGRAPFAVDTGAGPRGAGRF